MVTKAYYKKIILSVIYINLYYNIFDLFFHEESFPICLYDYVMKYLIYIYVHFQ
jgi:hypothetical protein